MVKSEYLLPVDPHTGHGYFDDGTCSPAEGVMAALSRGVFPAITGHNTMGGVEQYLLAMEQAGFGKLALPGVEFSFSFKTGDVRQWHGLPRDTQGFVVLGLGSNRFFDGSHRGLERNRHFTPVQIDEERKNIERIAVEFIGKPKEMIMPEMRLLAMELAKASGQLPDFSSEDIEEFYQSIAQGVQIASMDNGFPLIYLAFKEAKAEVPEKSISPLLTAFENYPEYMMLGMLGWAFETEKMVSDKDRIQKGEIVCLMPSEKSFLARMKPLVDYWRTSGAYKEKPLWILFDYLKHNLTEQEFEQLVWYVPHPISIDYSPFGRLLVRLLAREEMTLFPVEILSPENASLIDIVEIYNAAHPPEANRLSINVANSALLRKKGKGGGSDAHHPALAGGGGMLVGADNMTNEAIRKGMRYGRTLPYSGWGASSKTWLPFFAYIPTANTFIHRLVPELLYSKAGERIEVRQLFKLIEEANLFYKRNEIQGWVYLSDDRKSVQVYP